MMKTQILHRYTRAVLFECDVPDTVSSGMAMRHALEKAVDAKSNLSGAELRYANLSGADLRSANLRGADLSGADLRSAELRGANLSGANLRSADLSGANLSGANLSGADLRSADLRSANLSYGKTVGDRPYFSIGPIGSRSYYLTLWLTDKGPYIKTGCFTGTLDEFAAAVEKTHGDNDHGKEYQMAMLMMESHAVLWTPKIKVL